MGRSTSLTAIDNRGAFAGGEVVKLCDVSGEFPAMLIRQALKADGIGAVVQSDEMPLQPGWNFGGRVWGRVMVLETDLPHAAEIVRDLQAEMESEGGHEFNVSHTWYPNIQIGSLHRVEAAVLSIVLVLLASMLSPVPAVLAALIALVVLPRIWSSLARGIYYLPAGVAAAVVLPLYAFWLALRAAALTVWDWLNDITGGLLKRGRWRE